MNRAFLRIVAIQVLIAEGSGPEAIPQAKQARQT